MIEDTEQLPTLQLLGVQLVIPVMSASIMSVTNSTIFHLSTTINPALVKGEDARLIHDN